MHTINSSTAFTLKQLVIHNTECEDFVCGINKGGLMNYRILP